MTSQHDRSHALIADTFPTFPASLNGVRRELELLRGSTIRVVRSEPGDLSLPTALWARVSPVTDLVWVDATLGAVHQLVAICHEFAHMIHQHQPSKFGGDAGLVHGISRAAVADLAGVPDDQPTALLGRCGTDIATSDVDELLRETEAEATGRLLARPFVMAHHGELAALLIAD